MVDSVQPAVNLAEASSFDEDWLPITRFNEGEVYASRRAHALGALAQVRHRGLRLDGVLCYEVFGAITSDVQTKLEAAGFPTPKVEIVWEPPWTAKRISEEGKKTLGL